MSCSNTATPKYYAKFRDDVLSGKIPVCQTISMQMNRIDERIGNPRYYYDPAPLEGYIKFCESELTLTDGEPLHLLDSFKLWAEDLLCWFEFEYRSVYEPNGNGGGHFVQKKIKRRLTNTQYLIVGRGASKTLYETSIQAWVLTVDPMTTKQITTAPTMRQAEEVMSSFRTAITRARGPLFQFLTEGSLQNTTGSRANRQKLVSTKKGIENFLTNSILEVEPMSIDKLQGLRCKVASIDEWLSGELRESPITAIEQGASKVNDYIILAVSSEGTVRNGVGDSIKMELMKTLKNEYIDDHKSIWWYQLDDIKEVAHPEMWVKANPNLGQTVQYDTYQREVEKAEHNPAERNDILAKRFGIPLEGFTYFFTYEQTIPHRKRNFWGMSCSMGADLSQGDDFCAFTFLFPLSNGNFGVKALSYISSLTYNQLNMATRAKYDDFIREGSLVVLDCSVLDMMQVYDDLDKRIINDRYDVISFGYDPYNAKEFVTRWETENGPFGMCKVPQGAKTESVPLGEIQTFADQRMLIFDQEIMQYTMGNAIVLQDTNGNRKLSKKRREQKIDNVAALLDAYVAYKENKDNFE